MSMSVQGNKNANNGSWARGLTGLVADFFLLLPEPFVCLWSGLKRKWKTGSQ